MKLLRTLVFASVWLALPSCASVGRFSTSEAATIGAEPGEGARTAAQANVEAASMACTLSQSKPVKVMMLKSSAPRT